MNPLETATLDELIAEIGRRSDAGIVALQLKVRYRGGQILHRRRFGPPLYCRGILDTYRELFYQDLAADIGSAPPNAHEGT